MKVVAIIMLVLAILLGAVGGVAYAISWWVVPENTEYIALFTEQNIFKDGRELRPAESMVEMAEQYLTNTVVFAIFGAAAALIVFAIILLIVGGARKKAKRKKEARAFEAAQEAPVMMTATASAYAASEPTVAPVQTKPAMALSDDKKELLKKVAPIAIAGAAVLAVVVLMKRSSNKR